MPRPMPSSWLRSAPRGDCRAVVKASAGGADCRAGRCSTQDPFGSPCRPPSCDQHFPENRAFLVSVQGIDKVNSTKAPLAASRLWAMSTRLTYNPVTPCRIVDTRSGAGGTLGGRHPQLAGVEPGGEGHTQGGSATDCGIPVKPAAVVVNLTVANAGQGQRSW